MSDDALREAERRWRAPGDAVRAALARPDRVRGPAEVAVRPAPEGRERRRADRAAEELIAHVEAAKRYAAPIEEDLTRPTRGTDDPARPTARERRS